MIDLNNYGTFISIIIIYIVFFISIIIIIDEVYNVTKFCYKYTYLYNYGTLNEKTCSADNSTSIIEYEKARFRIYNVINNYKLEKDLFNKNWINYIVFITILLLTIVICVGFGVYFYTYFIANNSTCELPEGSDKSQYSILNLFLDCFFKTKVPNCTFNYFMVFIILIVYPLIFIGKAFFKVDFTWKSGYWSRVFHVVFATLLLYYCVVLFGDKQDKYVKLSIYLSYVIIFYIANYIYNNTFDEYNKSFKMSNIYDNNDDDRNKGLFAKKNNDYVSPNDKNDTMFFDIYKQEPPIKPSKPSILLTPPVDDDDGRNLLISFKYLTAEELRKIGIIIYCTLGTLDLTNGNNLPYYKTNILSTYGTSVPSIADLKIIVETKLTRQLLTTNNNDDDVIISKIKDIIVYSGFSGPAHLYHATAGVYVKYAMERLKLKEDSVALTNAFDSYKSHIYNVSYAVGENTAITETKPEISSPTDTEKNIIKASEAGKMPPLKMYDNAKIEYIKLSFVKNYNKNLTKINEYYTEQKKYEEALNIYNNKYNNYKNNRIDFPKLIFILYDIFPKLIGLDKPIVIIILVAIVVYIIIYGILRYLNHETYSNYMYNTIFIYLIGILTIFIISNSVLTYNTYFNKYLIYEPISQYKYDLNKLNTLFNITLNNNNIASTYQRLEFYKKITNKDIVTVANTDGLSTDINVIIEDIKNGKFTTATTDKNYLTGPASDDTLITAYISNLEPAILPIIRRALFRVIYSATIDTTITITPVPYILYTTIYNSSAYFNSSSSILLPANKAGLITTTTTTTISNIVKTFLLVIKKTFINDISTLKDRITAMKNNLKYILYTDVELTKSNIALTNDYFYNTFLFNKDFTKEELETINYTTDSKIVKTYNDNIIAIDNIFNVYEEFVLKFRKIVVDLLSFSDLYCEETATINIDSKLNEYFKKMFIKQDKSNDYKNLILTFKTAADEPKIDIYKSVLLNKMKEANILFINYFNVMKYLSLKTITKEEINNTQLKIISEIINNYNVFNKDNDKFNHLSLILKEFNLQCNYDNKFNSFGSKDKTEQDINMTNVSWSFVILIIIFAVILIEPTII